MAELRDIPEHEGRYMASSDGHVWGVTKGDYLSERTNKDGYKIVKLYVNGKPKLFLVHRLVAMAFIPNTENKKTVNHKNEVKTDNRVENLEWMTNIENIFYGTGRVRAVENNYHSKQISKPVYQLSLDGKIIMLHPSIKSASRYINADKGQIKKCLKGESKTCHGYVWKLKEQLNGCSFSVATQ